jgi:hypothetical protein
MADPMYRRIAEDLRQEIESGRLGAGSQLPTGLELADVVLSDELRHAGREPAPRGGQHRAWNRAVSPGDARPQAGWISRLDHDASAGRQRDDLLPNPGRRPRPVFEIFRTTFGRTGTPMRAPSRFSRPAGTSSPSTSARSRGRDGGLLQEMTTVVRPVSSVPAIRVVGIYLTSWHVGLPLTSWPASLTPIHHAIQTIPTFGSRPGYTSSPRVSGDRDPAIGRSRRSANQAGGTWWAGMYFREGRCQNPYTVGSLKICGRRLSPARWPREVSSRPRLSCGISTMRHVTPSGMR